MRLNLPVLALIAANIIWGAGSPIMKFTLAEVPPYSLAFLRFLFACLLFYPFLHKNLHYKDLKNKWLWLFALSGVTFNIIFFFLALEKTASVNAPIIGSTGPIMILVFSAIFLKERVTRRAVMGTIISLVGALVIILQPFFQGSFDGALPGNILLVLATISAVASTLCGRKFLTASNALPTTFWASLIGTLTFLPLMLGEFRANSDWLANVNLGGWLGVTYGAIFSSALAYAASAWALAKLPAFKVSIFAYIDPVAAIIIAVPLLGEKITPLFIIGSILIFFGIYLAEKRLHYHPIHKILSSN